MGAGSRGIIAVGDSWLKVREVMDAAGIREIRVLRLEEVCPLPKKRLRSFLTGLDRVLVVEETLPVVEQRMAAFCHQEGFTPSLWGKLSGHLPREDVLKAGHIYDGIAAVIDRVADSEIRARLAEDTEGWGEGKSLCRGCPYGKVVEALQTYWASHSIVAPTLTAEPGCGVRMYYPPYQKVDLLLCMGSATPLSAALALRFPGKRRPVAVIGESAFLNSGVPALIQACAMKASILVIVVNNYSAALTGFQPALELDPKETVQTLEKVIQGAGPAFFGSVEEREMERLLSIIDQAHTAHGTSVILVNAPCTGTP